MLSQDPATATWHTPVYSNEALQLLGWAYENITGESMEDGFKTSILEPLGLSRSFWSPPKDDPNANVVELDPSTMKDLVGYDFEEGLATYTPTGGIYSSLGDLSAIGRSILSSSLLPPSTTREWLRPITHSQHTHTAIGRPWEIFRMDLPFTPGSEQTRLVDIYAKNGGVAAYLTYLILSPDHDIGFTLMVASKTSFSGDGDLDSTFNILSELLLEKWVPAAEAAAREAAGDDLAGTYVAEDGSDSTVELALVPGRLGLTVMKFVYNGTDFFATVGENLGFQGADLQFMGLKDQGEASFRAVFSNIESESSGRASVVGKKCGWTWGSAGWFTYGNAALDEVVYTLDADGKAAAVSFPALRLKLVKTSKEEANGGGDSRTASQEL
ncbi:beta-lactamase-like protein sdnR [Colletotrichum spaethianum]|uniref:Beta-lactamase-like protein sdnR n=1 Tax=Colletotrichum spaethianum TaxID=700344 RepID=A0AA37ULP5_9PEZI|nr:beta-lactamase-like protein sdnR [Colletotrichum spaethianum]GKT52276.1 beta-lactamase-like protein sdnR [Colletotrichum spaethianum]